MATVEQVSLQGQVASHWQLVHWHMGPHLQVELGGASEHSAQYRGRRLLCANSERGPLRATRLFSCEDAPVDVHRLENVGTAATGK